MKTFLLVIWLLCLIPFLLPASDQFKILLFNYQNHDLKLEFPKDWEFEALEKKLTEEITLNILYLIKETESKRIVPASLLEFHFFQNDFLGTVVFLKEKNEGFSIQYQIINLVHEQGSISFLKLKKIETGISPDANGSSYLYHVYNIKKSEKNDILERIVLQTEISPHSLIPAFEKMIKGTEITYKDYNSKKEPRGYIYKTFMLDRFGNRKWNHVKESVNAEFDDQGNLIRETVRETSYSYNQDTIQYSIFNLSLDSIGHTISFDLLFEPNTAESPKLEHLRIDFENYKGKIPQKKLIRAYQISDQKRFFKSGKEIIQQEKDNLLFHVRESDFLIREKTSGLTEDERIYHNTYWIYHLEWDEKKRIRKKRILETGYWEKQKSFRSFRDVLFEYPGTSPGCISVVFYGISGEGLNTERKLQIEILEENEGKPVKIKTNLYDTQENLVLEQILEKDCQFFIDEAVYGNTFLPPLNETEKVILIEINEEGFPEKWKINPINEQSSHESPPEPQKPLQT